MKLFHLTVASFATSDLGIFVLTPDDVTNDKAAAAWAYAVQYSAKGLMLPDWEAAKALLVQRHPEWQFASSFETVKLELSLSSRDEVEL